ncbi:hypothetical protein QF035_000549 [Streptomyces umbrinus]|uniref:Uncharacterized protein n=1 Tax=Streptomyces umbrinus TaxID=67370 RepID=A0ABU0SHC0_9ACTN|nr:hypothetical protein [Streptomyces umbrinus]MDQ1022967.1 hypothetical protein [Streptomyces umbrinus]
MNGGKLTGRMEECCSCMAIRAVKFGLDPGDANKWPEGVGRLAWVEQLSGGGP